MPTTERCDLAIVGGGLAGGLVAHALAVRRPELAVRVIEPQAAFGGNHVWSFFTSDIAPEDRWIVEPFVDHRWDGYEVRFPSHRRTLSTGYNSIRSHSFDRQLRALLKPGTFIRAGAIEVTPTSATLDTQAVVAADGVIDARGPADLALLDLGWQKFLGRELALAHPHGLRAPIVMDATVDQHDGFRFVYVLPFAPDRVFVEDTYYSDGPDLSADTLRERILTYAHGAGWQVEHVLSEERAALPITLDGDFEGYWAAGGDAAKIGMRAAMFQPATGYSLPCAVRAAALIARMTDLSGAALVDALHRLARATWQEGRFYRLLNRMAFHAAAPPVRRRLYERFYRLRPGLIERFYAGRSTTFDKLRILAGKPAVPIGRAFNVLMER